MKDQSIRRDAIVALILMFLSVAIPEVDAQPLFAPRPSIYENYDVRETESPDAATALTARSGYRARQITSSRTQKLAAMDRSASVARADLQKKVPTLQMENNRFGNALEIVGTAGGRQFLTAPSAASHEATLRGFLANHAAVYGLTAAETAALVKHSDYANPAGNLAWVGLRQELNGLPVFQGELMAGFTPGGALARTTGNLAVGLRPADLPVAPILTPAQAASRAAAGIGYQVKPTSMRLHSVEANGRVTYLGSGPFVREIKTELLYFPMEPGVATLAYAMVLWEKVHAYYVLVDAGDGTLLWRKNITQDQTQTATYNVYSGSSPTPLTPSDILPGAGTQPPSVPRVNFTLVADDLNASPLGWITDGGNATIGNNVTAGLDIDGVDGVDGNVAGANRVFSFAYNPAPGLSGAPGSSTPSDPNYRQGIVSNLFFWTNRYHDALYNLGFTEAAGNFQSTNTFTLNGVSTNRGGVAGDAISAEAQDSSGVNNSNFSTPPDGTPGRMQMYLFTNTTPRRDGSVDGDVFLHEMTHGTSNRLHANGSGLATQQSGGMGEGWSDFYARCLLSRADEDVNGIFPASAYSSYEIAGGFHDNYYYGIREFPYAVKSNVGANGKPHDPRSFADLDLFQINGLSNGAYPSSPIISITAYEVHNIGHFWCTTLLEMRARIIQRLGYAVGNQRALQIVTDAMKLDVASPTIVQGRDSIIAADNAGYAGEDVPDIRTAFALRGVGAGATTTGGSSFTIVESSYPSSVTGVITFSDSLGNNNGVADPGEDLVFTVPLTNKLPTADANVIAVLGTYTAGYGTLASGATAARTFAYHVPATATPGTLLQVPFAVASPNGTASVTVPMRIGTPTVNVAFSENFDATAVGSLPAGWTQTGTVGGSTWAVNAGTIDSGHSVFAADVNKASDSSLISPAILLAGNLSYQLSFKHRYSVQTGFDGGVLEISIAGGAFTDIITAGGTWVQGGYGVNIDPSATTNTLVNRRAWSGLINATGLVIVDLPASVAGKNVQFRWRLGCDSTTAVAGWYLDNVQIYSTTYASTPIDTDGDGIPDGYETAHGFNPNDPTDASLDADGDGASNLHEYLAGTDPRDAQSRLVISSTTDSAGTGASIGFNGVNGKTYLIEYKDDLNAATWTTLKSGLVSDGGYLQITDAGATGHPQRFYRARLTGQ